MAFDLKFATPLLSPINISPPHFFGPKLSNEIFILRPYLQHLNAYRMAYYLKFPIKNALLRAIRLPKKGHRKQ
jgi:hypothetical protein